MEERGISTFPRFLYLNTYAFLLLFIGIGIGVIPLYKISLWLVALQAIPVFICLKGAMRIFSSWDTKKREYSILFRKNEQEISPASFSEYMQAPCGRLTTKLVLKDLGKSEAYEDLKKYKKPYIYKLKEGCKGQKTVVTVYKRD